MSLLGRALTVFCIATVLTQLILTGYFLTRGSLSSDTLTRVIALMNGIDISGNRLQQIIQAGEDREQPDFNEILEARKLDSLDMEMQLRSLAKFRDEISQKLAKLKADSENFDDRRAALNADLEEVKKGAQDEGLSEVQRTIQVLPPAQAKQQLKIIYDDDRVDDVVNIVKAMSTEKKAEVLAEFEDEPDILAEILKQIAAGLPTTELIDDFKNN